MHLAAPPVAPIRILHTLTALPPYGAERVMLSICEGLTVRYRHRVFAPMGGSLQACLQRSRISHCVMRHGLVRRRLLRGPAVAASLLRCCVSYRPHVIHSHHSGAWPYSALAALLTGSALVLHVHGVVRMSWPVAVARRLLRLLPPARWRVLAVSHGAGNAFREATGIPCEIMPNPVDGEALRAQASAGMSAHVACDVPSSAVVVLVVARAIPVKNPGAVVRCAQIACQQDDRIHFAWAGDGPMLEEMRQRTIALGLAGRFHWLGYRDDVPSLLASSHLLVLLSRQEGFGRVLTEAMAFGLPIVATDVTAINEVVTDSIDGLLVPDDDAQAAAAAILRLARDAELRSTMGAAGRRAADTKFGTMSFYEGVAAVYDELAVPRTPMKSSVE